MAVSPIRKNVQELSLDSVETQKKEVNAIDSLFQSIAKLQAPTLEDVEAISRRAKELELEMAKKFEGRGKPLVRLFARFRMFAEYFKILRLKKEIQGLRHQAEKIKEESVIEKSIWQITRRGFSTSLSEAEIQEQFYVLKPCLDTLECKSAFSFRILSRQEGKLVCHILSEGQHDRLSISLTHTLGKLTVLGSDASDICSIHDTLDGFLSQYAKDAICLSQLHDVSMWLERHGKPVRLHSQELEDKLSKLMGACPHGAYILYPAAKGTLMLSRLDHLGGVHHLALDLLKQPGSYTYTLENGAPYSALPTEIKRKLSLFGTPVCLSRS